MEDNSLEADTKVENMEVLLIGLLPMTCSNHFLISPRPTFPGIKTHNYMGFAISIMNPKLSPKGLPKLI